MERQKELQKAFNKSLEARSLPLPTADRDVRLKLRECGQPQMLFGEGPYERRERLRATLSQSTMKDSGAAAKAAKAAAAAAGPQQVSSSETFYTEGSADLAVCRKCIAYYAMPFIYERMSLQPEAPSPTSASAASLTCISSVVVDDRPVLTADWSCDGKEFVTAGLSGAIRFWDPDLLAAGEQNALSSISTGCRIHCVRAHPKNSKILAAGNADGIINLYSDNRSAAAACFQGHELQVNRLDFHPSGYWLGSSSLDETWRYWDVERGEELLLQEGHARGVYGIKHNEEGSLLATGDFGGVIRVWDLRVGKSILALREHLGPCLSFAWSKPHELLSASSDHSIRIWDLRSPKTTADLPPPLGENQTDQTAVLSSDILAGHSHVISDLQLAPNYLISSSHDRTARIWKLKSFQCEKVLIGHEGFVFKTIASPVRQSPPRYLSVSYDRTVKVWEEDKPR